MSNSLCPMGAAFRLNEIIGTIMICGAITLEDISIAWELTFKGTEYIVRMLDIPLVEEVIIPQERFTLFVLAMYVATSHEGTLPEGCTVPYEALDEVMPKNPELRWIP